MEDIIETEAQQRMQVRVDRVLCQVRVDRVLCITR